MKPLERLAVCRAYAKNPIRSLSNLKNYTQVASSSKTNRLLQLLQRPLSASIGRRASRPQGPTLPAARLSAGVDCRNTRQGYYNHLSILLQLFNSSQNRILVTLMFLDDCA